jgi:hypothetical protein
MTVADFGMRQERQCADSDMATRNGGMEFED